MSNELTKVVPPALPVSTAEYSQQEIGNFRNVLRLFFSRFSTLVENVFSTDNGGKFLHFPVGRFVSGTTQTATASTPTAVTWDSAGISDGVTLENTDEIHVEHDGIYNIEVSVFANTSTAYNIVLWVTVNTVNVADSARFHSVSALTYVDLQFTLELSANDYIQIMWTHSGAVSLLVSGPTAPWPRWPSAMLSVTYVSNS